MTQTQIINHIIEKGKEQEMTTAQIINDYVNQWTVSAKRSLMLTGQRYYEGDNDINHYKRTVVGEGGMLYEDKTLTNSKLSHNFARKLTDQKCQYLLGKPFSLCGDNKAYLDKLEKMLDKSFRAMLKTACKEAINKGIAWIMPYFEQSKLKFKIIPSEQVIPVWKDGAHTELDGVIRTYQSEEYDGTERKMVTYAQWWTTDGVEYFVQQNGQMVSDYRNPKSSHITVNGTDYNFKRVPFIFVKYNEEELPLIKFVKSLIDDYDMLMSHDSNSILDTPNNILVVKNYDGMSLGEFRKNIAQYKAVKVSDNGDVTALGTKINTDSIKTHTQITHANIYEVGRGVDTQCIELGDASGVAIKYRFADLELDCCGIETQLMQTLDSVLYFINILLSLTNQGNFFDEKVDFVFARDIIVSEKETIENCKNSADILPNDVIVANHPWSR